MRYPPKQRNANSTRTPNTPAANRKVRLFDSSGGAPSSSKLSTLSSLYMDILHSPLYMLLIIPQLQGLPKERARWRHFPALLPRLVRAIRLAKGSRHQAD